ncbi:Protein-glutamate methylesterase/protein-glutamine glutaminase [Methylobacterium crusticola]|uniref:Protein-glutamate methylesterase/protein-glutamine glutaminase n=1 Tax=Methylobacterium crusticola TaxID=1697972 RepID=A0ABQ4QS02_9HYPH|nr:response regulator [Methylobacterium crusticola]GJD47972.1 Protein-glutamate methylesterase/protein-glutamine glutaminase [Methylobacterium crusticola]
MTGTSLRVLIVEDEAFIALELECLLEEAGHVPVGIAGHSAQAIALGRDQRPDVALVDVHLVDGPTGIAVARALSAQPETTVLFTTANAKRLPEDFAGAAGVIAKPYSERVVRAALAYIAGRRQGGDPGAPPDGVTLAPDLQNRS